MELKVNGKVLEKVLSHAISVVDEDPASYVLIKAKENVSLTMTSLNTSLKVIMSADDVEIITPGTAHIPLSRLVKIINEISDDNVNIEIKSNVVTGRYRKSRSKFFKCLYKSFTLTAKL